MVLVNESFPSFSTRIPNSVVHQHWVWRLAFSPDGTRGGDIHLIDTATGAEVGRVDLVSDKPRSLWWSADGKHLVIDTEHRFRITLDRS